MFLGGMAGVSSTGIYNTQVIITDLLNRIVLVQINAMFKSLLFVAFNDSELQLTSLLCA